MEPMKQPTNLPIQTTEARLPQPAPRRFQLKLRKHTGMLVLMRSQTFMVQGSLEQCEAA